LEAQEHSGFAVPARQPIVDFQDWTDTNFLIHLPTTGAYLTWSNGRKGARHTERRLDRAICNQDWMDACTTLGCSTLVRNQSDHYPLLLNFTNHNLTFKSSFKFMKMWSLHDNCKDVIAASWNVL
jgi:exonuclease III